ncbi:MAG: hypothetical protein ABJF04_17245 [Reichenbachiella sp.]|uniref:hypothetical protein n=1 Tax=Reichenbachiella sp. TaxID=2184521 RepID=UPI0032660C9F
MSYNSKTQDSFETKWRLFCFSHAIDQTPELSVDTFYEFKINERLIKLYTTKYLQFLPKEPIDEIGKTPEHIYNTIQTLEGKEIKAVCRKHYVDHFEKQWSKKDHDELIKHGQCYYCELTLEDFEQLYNQSKIHKKANRGFNLEIDRKSPNLEYSKDNCVMACYWCNNAKTDEFEADEFKPIGLAIGKALKARVKSQ